MVIFILILILQIHCDDTLIVRTTSGSVKGKAIQIGDDCVEQYLNLPYSEPPIGRLRFSRPVPIQRPKHGIIDGTKLGYECYQFNQWYEYPVYQSEDCLVLNIWTKRGKSGNDLKPVMFYIHGGGFQWGTVFQPVLNGVILSTHDVVVVTVNYRLGVFGFLYGGTDEAPGNLGLYDQRLALLWVKNNIHLFGGDANQVTIFGQSVGSVSVSAHIMTNMTRGLFKRAILESGNMLSNKETPRLPKSVALNETQNMIEYFGCSQSNQWLDCLRRVEAKALNNYPNITAYPILETEYLPLTPLNAFKLGLYHQDIDLMAGVVRDEGTLLIDTEFPQSNNIRSRKQFIDLVNSSGFPNLDIIRITEFYLKNVNTTDTEAMFQAFARYYGDIGLTCPTYLFAKIFATLTPKKNVLFYYWTYVSRFIASELRCREDMGVCHQSDVAYIWGEPVIRNLSDRQFSEYTNKLWTNFAKTGNPMDGFPPEFQWPRLISGGFDSKPTKTKEINPKRLNHVINNLFAHNCEDFWRNYFV